MPPNVRRFLQAISSEIYPDITGIERQEYIASLVRNFSEEWKRILKTFLAGFLEQMITVRASDVDIGGAGCAGSVWFRVYGVKKPQHKLGEYPLDYSDILIHNLLTDYQREYLFTHRNLDFSYAIAIDGTATRFRADVYFDLDHLALNMRYIPNVIRPFKDLGLHTNVVRVVSLETSKSGLTLITGVTGSGKSSTLDSIIDANNRSMDAHIVIIGAPIETVHTPKRSIVRHREVGRDVLSFKDGVVQALRQDPNIIVIGEMRDPDTIMTALEITDSGHKVFSTLHTASAVESIDRIIGEMPTGEQERTRIRLADTLNCIVSQKLVPNSSGTRTLAKEVLLITSAVRAAIRNGNTGEIYQIIFESAEYGMITLEQDLLRLVRQRIITSDTAVHFANNKKRIEELLNN
jgi:twitching motility protein PilT